MIFRKLLVGAAWLLLAPLAHAALTIEIVGSGANQIPISVVPFAGENALPQGITAVIAADLQRSGLFKIVDPAGVRPEPHELAEVNYPDWRTRGADALAVGSALPRSDGKLEVRFRLLDAVKQAQLDAYSYVIDRAQTRATAHKIADLIYEKLTGDVGVFSTRIAYIVKSRSHYELQVADADGYGAQTVLASKEPIISPSWSPNGAKLAYVSFERKKPIIYVQSLVSSQRQVLAQFKGNNSAPAWSPDGKQLAIVLTKDGSSQIYLINADGSGVKRLSYSSGIDTEPSFSPDGAAIIFTSDRGGSPQIYRMSVSGSGAQRLTFEGNYNVSPRFSPDGKSFTFIHRVSGSSFHVALQDLASGQMQVLTDTRMDEAPSFAPNGKMLLYATEIGGRGVLAAVSSDGRVKQRLSTQAGDVREPEWGPLLKN